MDLDIFRHLLSGLIGSLILYLLARAGQKPAARQGDLRVLSYGTAFRVMAALLMPGSLFLAYAVALEGQSQDILAGIATATFLFASFYLAYQAFLVSFAYDEQNIYYRSPLAGYNVIPWAEVEEVAYSDIFQSHYIRTRQVGRIWCTNMLHGYEELGEFLAKKHEELYGNEP